MSIANGVARREMDRFAYIWTILKAFTLFVALVTVGMLAWIVGII